MKTALPAPPEKIHHRLYKKPSSKNWDPVKPAHFENLVGGSTSHHSRKVGGAHYGHTPRQIGTKEKQILVIKELGFVQIC